MRKSILLAAALLFGTAGFAQWQPVGDKIKTPWADQVDPQNPLPEYPRPLMERDRWQNLNGLWDYAIVPVGAQPERLDSTANGTRIFPSYFSGCAPTGTMA